MKEGGSRKQLKENRNKVKEKEEETCVGKDVGEEKKGAKGGKLIEGCCYQSEICQSVAISLDTAATLIPSPLKRLKPLKQASFISSQTDKDRGSKLSSKLKEME